MKPTFVVAKRLSTRSKRVKTFKPLNPTDSKSRSRNRPGSEFRFFSPQFFLLISRPHPQISRNFREISELGSPSPIYGTPKQVFGGRPSQHLWQTRPRRPKISRLCAARPARRPKFREILRRCAAPKFRTKIYESLAWAYCAAVKVRLDKSLKFSSAAPRP